ncbi:hypothetical protein ADIARSV_4114 [Arcticibacter svalbardensis MN12-7]|uniref:Uncharacterized protein n=1 Tax=Arcticibacter svalbardensis MN12-7 TaxID=1150600 RepID=R9GL94_9SPHI|nr:hypothetical protein ADIARSV_4114 [Arcticibacter svalbardensis MN12-7]
MGTLNTISNAMIKFTVFICDLKVNIRLNMHQPDVRYILI